MGWDYCCFLGQNHHHAYVCIYATILSEQLPTVVARCRHSAGILFVAEQDSVQSTGLQRRLNRAKDIQFKTCMLLI